VAPDLDRLLDEAERQPFEGWDFSWLEGRTSVEPLPWDFETLAAERARQSPDLLDMGTGGGERLSELPGRPAGTVATEAWAPNVPVAARRLHPLGIPVVYAEGAPDNVDQESERPAGELGGRLPFRDGSFHLITNRHESFVASEIRRVLAPGGCFLTQQIANDWANDYYRLLGLPLPSPPPRRWDLVLAVSQVEAGGLQVVARGEADERRRFFDVGALAWYLKVVPWAIPGFTIAGFREQLARLHARIASDGPLTVSVPHFWLEARKPYVAR
jgi:SAM-dependent methyltransferase